MTHQTIDMTCAYCGETFLALRATAKYCCSTCKTYASQVRTGRKVLQPVHDNSGLPSPEQEATQKKHKQQVQENLDAVTTQRKAIFELVQELQESEKVLRNEIRSNLSEPMQLERLNLQAGQLQKQIGQLKHQHDCLLYDELKLKQERLDLHFVDTWNRGEIKGSDLPTFAEYRVRYPFQEMFHYFNLAALGNPPQPFICYFCEGDPLYLVNVLIGVAEELLTHIKGKTLFIIDRQMMNQYFEQSILKHKLESDLITLKFADNRSEIEAFLQKEYFEFVFFPDLSAFNLDYDFLMSLLKAHPKTSIFCASEKPLRDFLSRNRLNVQMTTAWDDTMCGGVVVTPHSEYIFVP